MADVDICSMLLGYSLLELAVFEDVLFQCSGWIGQLADGAVHGASIPVQEEVDALCEVIGIAG